MEMQSFLILNDVIRRSIKQAIDAAPLGYRVTITPPVRSLEQNDKLHGLLRSIANQAEWGGQKWPVEDWKLLFCAAAYGQTVLPSLDGKGMVVLNKQTRKMNKQMMSDLIEYITAWAIDHGVIFDESE